ncbi:peroxidase family protein [Mesobacterium sp. TK19101]|uniref:Peroxidase family protein n=1 Tax=Mesobacterium hydrothermale TaxID=3111907 RepID=A0ABU6HL24_9RHOB|nr:peroxidase family protein [Mesobacterium sp. TK19101]MEC3863158.1 peroxidase family protein [Mesobacterium sp. TK19101]
METATATHGVKTNIDIQGEGRANDTPPGFRFGRMFAPAKAPPMILKQSTSVRLGQHMTSRSEAERTDTDVPAGYTYLGQFIDHDITRDVTEPSQEGDEAATDAIEATTDEALLQGRSPSLDLDSVYGTLTGAKPEFMNGFRFIVGPTSGSPGAGASGKSILADLPRRNQKAQIGDDRNDENLAVAQTHLMFLQFHNAVADTLAEANPGSAPSTIVTAARDLVTRHYQHIVLHDYLPRILDAGVYDDIIVKGNRKVLAQGPGETAFMPLEFSVAGYRLGHSQVREEYEWNVNFSTGGAVVPRPARFDQIFRFSGGSGDFAGLPTLPTNWVADFRRLYDLSGRAFPNLAGSVEGPLNMTKALDPYIAPALGILPGMPVGLNNLAMLNLRRGGMRGLPSGQDVSRALPSVRMLTKTQMQSVLDPAFRQTMESLMLYERTPLWLYILIEAAVVNDGRRLGPLGSTIVADTFLTLVLTSRTSILAPGAHWTPDQAQAALGTAAPIATVADLLTWTDLRVPVVDAIQDARNA